MPPFLPMLFRRCQRRFCHAAAPNTTTLALPCRVLQYIRVAISLSMLATLRRFTPCHSCRFRRAFFDTAATFRRFDAAAIRYFSLRAILFELL